MLISIYHKVNSLIHGCTRSIMATKEFDELTLDGSNYPTWASNIKISMEDATITLSMGTQIMEDALLYPDSTRTLLSYRDIRKNGFYVETHQDNCDRTAQTKPA